MRFTKMHGAGNDFVVLDLRDGAPPPDAALAARLADRHRGVGCDQILTLEAPRSAQAVASYRIWNSDGSPSQQCGNGARCVAAWLVRDGTARGDTFELDSPLATHAVQRIGETGFAIAMGVPDFVPAHIPMHGITREQDEYEADVDEGVRLRFGAVSMGNPHAVIELPSVEHAPVTQYGSLLQRSRHFPESVNVGCAEVLSPRHVRLRVFERGVGETLACGSGACAAAAVLIRRGRIDRDATISLPGGDLQIRWPADNAQVIMAGPTAFVFEGEWKA